MPVPASKLYGGKIIPKKSDVTIRPTLMLAPTQVSGATMLRLRRWVLHYPGAHYWWTDNGQKVRPYGITTSCMRCIQVEGRRPQ